jgi:hypothetical protein
MAILYDEGGFAARTWATLVMVLRWIECPA